MTDRPVPPEVAKRRWYALAQRHRRMAESLRRAGYRDGAVFHAYHAYECVISAFLAARGRRVPASHSGRFRLFEAIVDGSNESDAAYRRLGFLTVRVRNDALYYDEQEHLLPDERFDEAFVDHLMPLVHQFALTVWREIR